MQSDNCRNCSNYLGGLKCLAFEIIPNDILIGDNPHTEPIPNQFNNVVHTDKNTLIEPELVNFNN